MEPFEHAQQSQLSDFSLREKTKENSSILSQKQDQNQKNEKSGETTSSPPQISRLRHDWYQNDSHVIISIYIRNVPKDGNVKCEFTSSSVSISSPHPTNPSTEIHFSLDPLSHEIDPSKSTFQVLTSKIELKLGKARNGLTWSKLERPTEEENFSTTIYPRPSSSQQPSGVKYPTSSKRGPKNWDVLAKDVEIDQPSTGGDQALNEFFQTLYKDADEDTRRAMIKSFQESNGTTLSTNWNEVSKDTVKTQPPTGMMAKKYGE